MKFIRWYRWLKKQLKMAVGTYITKGGTLPTSLGELYGVNIQKQAIIDFHVSVNSVQGRTMTIYHEINGQIFRISPSDLYLRTGETWQCTGLKMKTGDRIMGFCSGAGAVDYTINVEEFDVGA